MLLIIDENKFDVPPSRQLIDEINMIQRLFKFLSIKI